MAHNYYKKHYYVTYKDRRENSGKYPHDIILERLIAYDVALKYIREYFESFSRENTLSIEGCVEPILITNDTRLYMQFRNVFSQSEFEQFCIKDHKATTETYEHLIAIIQGRYNTAEMYSKSEEWTDEDGNTYDCEYENGWRNSAYMITNKILTKGFNLDDELYKDDLIKIGDHHYEWWAELENNWKKYFTYLTSSGVFGGIPTHFALADLLTLEELSYEFGDDKYFEQLRSINPLSQFQFLRILNLRHNKIDNLSPLENIKTLECLNIENNLVESLSPLQNLPNLYELKASNNKIKHYNAIASLKKLIVNNNSIVDLINITKSKNIEHLEINYNDISDLTELSMLKHLKYLSLTGNKIVNIEPLTFLQNLEILKLDNNQLETIEPLKKMKSLTELSFKNNKVHDPTPISKLARLKTLSCGGNQFSYGEVLSMSSSQGFYLNFW